MRNATAASIGNATITGAGFTNATLNSLAGGQSGALSANPPNTASALGGQPFTITSPAPFVVAWQW